MPFHSEIQPHLTGSAAWYAAFLAFAVMAGRRLVQVIRS